MAIKLANILFIDDNLDLSEAVIDQENFDIADPVNGLSAATPKGPRAGMVAVLETSTGKSRTHKAAAGAFKTLRPLGLYRHDLRRGSGEDIGTGRQVTGIVPEPGLTPARKLAIIRGSAVFETDIFQDDVFAVNDLLYNDLARGVLTRVKPTAQPSGGGARDDELAILLRVADTDGFAKIHFILP